MNTNMPSLIPMPAGRFGFHDGDRLVADVLTGVDGEVYSPDGDTGHTPEDYGFERISTGGGCTAWSRNFMLDGMPVYLLVTDTGGMSHGIEPGEDALYGIYHDGDAGEALHQWTHVRAAQTDDDPRVVHQDVSPRWVDKMDTEILAIESDSEVGRRVIDACRAADVLLAVIDESEQAFAIEYAVRETCAIWFFG